MEGGHAARPVNSFFALVVLAGCSSEPPQTKAGTAACEECRAERPKDAPPERVANGSKVSIWKPEERGMIRALTGTYETGKAPADAKFLSMSDERGVPLAPRDPGAKGLDGELLLGKPLPTTRFVGSSGEVVDLADLAGKKNVVLVILRGFDGAVCMACTGQTLAISQNLAAFKTREAEVFFVYPGRRETVNAFLDAVRDAGGASLPVEVLLDIDLAVVREMKIEDRLAKPTTIILDKQGRVRFAHVGRAKTDRPSVPRMLEMLSGLQSDAARK